MEISVIKHLLNESFCSYLFDSLIAPRLSFEMHQGERKRVIESIGNRSVLVSPL